MRKGVIDRFEGDIAVIEWLDNQEKLDLPCTKLPKGAEVGDVLLFDGATWKVDKEETERRGKEIKKLMEELWED